MESYTLAHNAVDDLRMHQQITDLILVLLPFLTKFYSSHYDVSMPQFTYGIDSTKHWADFKFDNLISLFLETEL